MAFSVDDVGGVRPWFGGSFIFILFHFCVLNSTGGASVAWGKVIIILFIFVVIFIFPITACLQRSVNFLLYSKVTPSHIHGLGIWG